MKEIIEQIIDNIDQTVRLYGEILETERQKRQAIAESEVGALAEIVAREERLVDRADQLEAQRLALRGRLVEGRSDLGPNPRLRQVIELLDGSEREELARKHQQLLELGEQINDVNRTNFHLLRRSMDQLRASLLWNTRAGRAVQAVLPDPSRPVQCRIYTEPDPGRCNEEVARAQPAEE